MVGHHAARRDVFVDGAVNDDRDLWDVAVASAAAAGRSGWDRELLDGFLDDAARASAGGTAPDRDAVVAPLPGL